MNKTTKCHPFAIRYPLPKVIKQVEHEIRWLTDTQYGLDDMSEPFSDALYSLWMEGFNPAEIAQEFVEYTFPDPLPKEC